MNSHIRIIFLGAEKKSTLENKGACLGGEMSRLKSKGVKIQAA